jgi:uncharacterized phage protein (TIGR02220 family)
MSVLRKKITEDFTCVHNAFIRDTKLSITSKGMLLVMLSLPDNWNFSISGLQSILPDGKDKVGNTLKDLEKKGYLRRSKIYSDKGVITDWEYCFSDEPVFLGENGTASENEPQSGKPDVDETQGSFPLSENPHVEKPDMDYPHMENTDAYKILSDKILNDQVLINQSCGEAPQPVSEGSVKSSSKKKEIDEAVYEAIIGYLNDKARTKYSSKSKSNRKYIEARLKEGYSADDFKKIIDKKCREWMGTDMVKYLRPETLFCDKHFESYLNSPEPAYSSGSQPVNRNAAQPQNSKSMMELLNEYLED